MFEKHFALLCFPARCSKIPNSNRLFFPKLVCHLRVRTFPGLSSAKEIGWHRIQNKKSNFQTAASKQEAHRQIAMLAFFHHPGFFEYK